MNILVIALPVRERKEGERKSWETEKGWAGVEGSNRGGGGERKVARDSELDLKTLFYKDSS